MIYILSFLRRLQFKSAFYFALPAGLVAYLFSYCHFGLEHTDSGITALAAIALTTGVFLLGSLLVLKSDLKKTTGVECLICRYQNCVLLYPARRKKNIPIGSFACSSFDHGEYPNIMFCPVCRNGFLENVLKNAESESTAAQQEKVTVQMYSNVVDEAYIKNLPARYKTYQKVVQRYKGLLKDKDILEVGCYYGAFHNEAIKVAKSYTGIEPSHHACEYLKSKSPSSTILEGDVLSVLKSGKLESKKFDTIVMFDVIEHLSEPGLTIERLRHYLKPGGSLIFSTINIESTFSLFLGSRWPWFMDMHYYYFSDRGYHEILKAAGYRLTAHRHFSYYVPASYFVQKVAYLAWSKLRLPDNIPVLSKIMLKIQFGDTVLVIGTPTKP